MPVSLPVITGDGDRLAQVFSNLVDNALKHTPAGGKITVAARVLSGSSVVKKGKPWPGGIEISVAEPGTAFRRKIYRASSSGFIRWINHARGRDRAGAAWGWVCRS